MNKKLYITFFLLTSMLISGFGQVLKTFTNKNFETSDGQTGVLTYTYYEDASRNYIKHGKYSINASAEVLRYWDKEKRTYQNLRYQHTANATFKDGWLDGTVTITKKQEIEEGKSKVSHVQTETVNFKNGVPHGLWKITETTNNKASTLISMTFTDGILTGQFQWQDQTGQFDSEGRYSGTWTVRDYQTYIDHNFINGVEVSVIKRKDGTVIEKTPDEDIAIATKFANGEVLESELENMKYILYESGSLFSANLPTKPFYWNYYDLDKIGGDKTLVSEEYEKTLGKPYFYLKKIDYDILPDQMFDCILVDLGLMKTCKNHKPILEDYQDIYFVMQSENKLFIKGNNYYMTKKQREKLHQYSVEKYMESTLTEYSEEILKLLMVNAQDGVQALSSEKIIHNSASNFLPIVYYTLDSSSKIDNRTTVFCTIVKKTEDKKAPYQTWKSSFAFEEGAEDISSVEDATLNFNEAQRVTGPFDAIVEMRNTIKNEESVIMSLEKECPYFVKTYISNKKDIGSRFEDLDKLSANHLKPEEVKETYETRIMPLTLCFANLARQYENIKEVHKYLLEKTNYYSDIQKNYLKAVGEKPYDISDGNQQFASSSTFPLQDTFRLKSKYASISRTQQTYFELVNTIDARDQNRNKILNDPDKLCGDVVNWYKKNEKNFDQSLSGSISDITKKMRALVNFQNTTLRFMEVRKQISKRNEQITMNAGEFAKDVDKAYQAYAKNYDVSITADTVESFKRLQQLSTIQDSCLAFIAHRKLIADNEAQIIEKGKSCKNITKAYSAYMKSADLAWNPDLNCCNKLRNVINIQKQFLTAVSTSKAAELDEKIKKLKDKSVENVLKELK